MMRESVEIQKDTYDLLSERSDQKNMATDEYINQVLGEVAERVEPIVQREQKSRSRSDVEERLRDLGYI
jgi:hypothetical protein